MADFSRSADSGQWTYAAPMSLPLTVFVRNRHQLRASRGSERRTWERVVALLLALPGMFRSVIVHDPSLARGLEGSELSRQHAAGKVVLRP